MLLLMFEIGGRLLGLPARRVVEVVPSVPLEPYLARAHACVGIANYRGGQIRVYDLTLHMCGRPAASSLTTRIIVVDDMRGSSAVRVGLLAENVTETINVKNDAVFNFNPVESQTDVRPDCVAALDIDAMLTSFDASES